MNTALRQIPVTLPLIFILNRFRMTNPSGIWTEQEKLLPKCFISVQSFKHTLSSKFFQIFSPLFLYFLIKHPARHSLWRCLVFALGCVFRVHIRSCLAWDTRRANQLFNNSWLLYLHYSWGHNPLFNIKTSWVRTVFWIIIAFID